MVVVLSVLWFTASVNPFGIFKLSYSYQLYLKTLFINNCYVHQHKPHYKAVVNSGWACCFCSTSGTHPPRYECIKSSEKQRKKNDGITTSANSTYLWSSVVSHTMMPTANLRSNLPLGRRVWVYQRGNQNPLVRRIHSYQQPSIVKIMEENSSF